MEENISSLLATHKRSSLAFTKGRGVYLYDSNGNKYLDFAAGIAVNSLGHCHKIANRALQRQSKKLWHISNLYTIPEAENFASLICNKTFAKKVFFCNSGAEALEATIKILRRYHFVCGNANKNRIITFKGSFHGRTIATVCASANLKYMEGFAPHLDGFDSIEYGDIEIVKNAINEQTAAVLIEPIQGEGGVNFAGFEFLKQLRQLCDEKGILLALDEVQCGNGRTGKLFAYQHANIVPDVVATAKGIGNGFPLGAVFCTLESSKAITPGMHGTTYGCNPLAMAVGHAVFNYISQNKFLDSVVKISNYFMDKLTMLALKYPQKITTIKGYGLMLGIGLMDGFKSSDIVEKCRKNNLLIAGAGEGVVRILPPLIICKKHVDIAINTLDRIFASL